MLTCFSFSAVTLSANTLLQIRVFALQIVSMPTCSLCPHCTACKMFIEQVSLNCSTFWIERLLSFSGAFCTQPDSLESALACDYCDRPDGDKTIRNQGGMPINGTVICIERGRPRLVAALNAGGVRTSASCCGHGAMEGRIALDDGRSLIIRGSVSLPA